MRKVGKYGLIFPYPFEVPKKVLSGFSSQESHIRFIPIGLTGHECERRAFTAGLRRLHVRVDFVRGLTDEADEFIRLCDATAGFLRDSLEGDEDMQKLHRRAMTNHIIKKC